MNAEQAARDTGADERGAISEHFPREFDGEA